MAAIKLSEFGGMFPSLSARALPATAAQTATNLLAKSSEFFPLASNTSILTGISSGTKSLYRMSLTYAGADNTAVSTLASWLIPGTNEYSFARTPLNYQAGSATPERTYYTDNTTPGTMKLVYWTALNTLSAARQVGVPAPTTAPTATAFVVDETTASERAANLTNWVSTNISGTLDSGISYSWTNGQTLTASGYQDRASTTGWTKQGGGSVQTDPEQNLRGYRIASTAGAYTGALSNAYGVAGTTADQFAWVLDTRLAGFLATAGSGSPSWAWTSGATVDHYVLSFAARGRTATYDAARTSISTALTNLPSPAGSGFMFDAGDVTELMKRLDEKFAITTAGSVASQAKQLNDSLVAKLQALQPLLDGGTAAAKKAQLDAYYNSSAVAAEINTIFNDFARSVFNAAYAAARANAPESSYTGEIIWSPGP